MINYLLRFFFYIIICVLVCTCKKPSPVAEFDTQSNCSGITPCTVTFINKSQGADSYQWDFGDGKTSTLQSPTHTYTSGVSFKVTLEVTGNGKSDKITKEFKLNQTPGCETKGTFVCAKKLQTGLPLSDQFTNPANNYALYYYFKSDTPGVAKFTISPVPNGNGNMIIDVLTTANDNSTKIKSVFGSAGETISFYAGPISNQEYYVRVKYNSGTPSLNQNFIISYTFINTDLNEINNNFNDATLISYGLSKQGTILGNGDEDFFKVNQTQKGTLDVIVTPVPSFLPTSYLEANFYTNAVASSRIKQQINSSGETMKFSVGPIDTGIHYLQLKTFSSNYGESIDPYYLTIRFDTSDLNEINNTFANSTPISLNQTKRGTIKAAGDVDYFKFTASLNTTLKILMPTVPLGISNLRINVYSDANFSSLLSSNIYQQGTGINYTSPYNLVAGTLYYVRLESYQSGEESNSQYSLIVKQ